MAEQAGQVKMALPMNGPLEIQKKGSYSSVCLHPTISLAVSIHEDGDKLYYSVFRVDKEGGDPILTQPKDYEPGKQPSVALVCLEEENKTLAIATHRSRILKDFFYQIGIVNTSREIIEWQSTTQHSRGVKPKISASKNGTLVAIYEVTYTHEKMHYCIGKVTISTQNVPRITWTGKNLEIPDFKGVEPDVAINDTTIVVISRTGLTTLHTKVGTIQPDGVIDWGPTLPLPSPGINPTISINSKGYVVEIHQTKAFRSLCRSHGQILSDKTISWKQTSKYTTGEYPTVSINDENFVFEMHKTHLGNHLFHSQGELRITEESHK